jgi:hypothetical protein
MVENPEGLGADPDAWVARQVDFFGRRRQRLEWKTYDYDEPADLPERLVAAGFVAEDPEVVLLGSCADLVEEVALPPGTRLRDITSDEDWERVRATADRVWGEDTSWVNDALRLEQRRDPELLTATVAEDVGTGEVLSYAVLRVTPGTDFCGLWGGSTLRPASPSTGGTRWRASTPHRTRGRSSSPSGWCRSAGPARTCSSRMEASDNVVSQTTHSVGGHRPILCVSVAERSRSLSIRTRWGAIRHARRR